MFCAKLDAKQRSNHFPSIMSKTWNNFKSSFLSYQRSDRNAIIILASLILIVLTCIVILRNIDPKPNSDFTELKALIEEWEREEAEKQNTIVLFNFDPNTISKERLDSLTIPGTIKRNIINYRKAGGKYKSPADVRKIYGMTDSIYVILESYIQINEIAQAHIKPHIKHNVKHSEKITVKPSGYFNPNTATITELKKFGFSNYQANNLVNYRNKGGSFSSPDEIIKIYGIDSTFYKSIQEFVKVAETEEKKLIQPQQKILIELNSADSLDLVQLKGIGASYAKRIIKYRNLLGGFYSKQQIKEIYNFPEETFTRIQQDICVDTLKVIKLRINFLEYQELIRHPYLHKKEVKLILETRQKNGAFKNISEIQSIEGFDPDVFNRIIPYITCR